MTLVYIKKCNLNKMSGSWPSKNKEEKFDSLIPDPNDK